MCVFVCLWRVCRCVWLGVFVCMGVCVGVCVDECVCVCGCGCVCVWVCRCVCGHVCTGMCVCGCVCVCNVCEHVCVGMCESACVCKNIKFSVVTITVPILHFITASNMCRICHKTVTKECNNIRPAICGQIWNCQNPLL